MDPMTLINIIIGMVKGAKAAYDFIAEIKGDVPIPSWEDILAENTDLQGKIDKEM